MCVGVGVGDEMRRETFNVEVGGKSRHEVSEASWKIHEKHSRKIDVDT